MADEFFVSARLFLKLEVSLDRDPALHFFEQVRKAFPTMTRFQRRDDGSLMLDEPATGGPSRRWVRLDACGSLLGHFAPQLDNDTREVGDAVLNQAPYHLAFSELDFDHMEVVFGFDLEYRGNHDRLIAETFWTDHPLGEFLLGGRSHHVIDAQPYIGIALSAECDVQAYIEIRSRTGTYEVRTSEYEAQPLTVFLTLRKYWGVGKGQSLLDCHRMLFDLADELAADVVVPGVVNPLAQAIASRS